MKCKSIPPRPGFRLERGVKAALGETHSFPEARKEMAKTGKKIVSVKPHKRAKKGGKYKGTRDQRRNEE